MSGPRREIALSSSLRLGPEGADNLEALQKRWNTSQNGAIERGLRIVRRIVLEEQPGDRVVIERGGERIVLDL